MRTEQKPFTPLPANPLINLDLPLGVTAQNIQHVLRFLQEYESINDGIDSIGYANEGRYQVLKMVEQAVLWLGGVVEEDEEDAT